MVACAVQIHAANLCIRVLHRVHGRVREPLRPQGLYLPPPRLPLCQLQQLLIMLMVLSLPGSNVAVGRL